MDSEIVDVQGLVGLHIHDGQIDRPQTQLCQNTGQNCRDTQLGVEKACDPTGKHTGHKSHQHSHPYIIARNHHHGTNCTTGAEGTVNSQVGKLQHFVCNIQANGHNTPYQTL